MVKSLSGVKVVHDEVEDVKILVLLCTEGALALFWRACRRRTNLAVGYAACNDLKWLVETVNSEHAVGTATFSPWPGPT